MNETENIFYHGDCIDVLRGDIPPKSIDLIYLDPPFFTGKVQKGAIKEKTDQWNPGTMQISYDDSKKFWSNQTIQNKDKVPVWIVEIANREPASHYSPLARYLYYMYERLQLCRNVLKPTGSIYMHCDWRASHYLKIIMDEIFGYDNFRNEIVWCYSGGGIPKKDFPRKHDIIFRYTKNFEKYKKHSIFNIEYRPYGDWTKKHEPRHSLTAGGKSLDMKKGTPINDWWVDLKSLTSYQSDWLGYPTQKPEALLERIIKASSNPGDLVLDPFCGCGTTIAVSHRLNRKWIGIDINGDAIDIIKQRISKMNLNQTKINFKVSYPIFKTSLDTIMKMNGFDFEKWVNKFYSATKPSPDRGVDGITPDGIPIQTKTYIVKYDKVSQFNEDIKDHPKVPKPIKVIRIVSQKGFDESAFKKAMQISQRDKIKVELITPKEMFKNKN